MSAPVAPVTTTSATVMPVQAAALQTEPVAPNVVVAPPQQAPVVSDPNPAPVIDRMEQFYGKNIPFEADVSLEHFVKSHNVQKSEKGKLVFDRRGRFRLTMSNGNVIDADAGTLTVFDPTGGHAYQQNVAADHCPAALGFAMAPGALQKHLGVQRFDGIGLNAPGVDVLLATPRQPHRSVSKLLFYVRPTGEVPRLMVIPPTGDRVSVNLSNFSTQTKWPGALKLPAGTNIVQVAPTQPQAPFVATIP